MEMDDESTLKDMNTTDLPGSSRHEFQQQKRKLSTYTETIKEKKPALIGRPSMNHQSQLAADIHSQSSSSHIRDNNNSQNQIKPLPECEGLLRRLNNANCGSSIGNVDYLPHMVDNGCSGDEYTHIDSNDKETYRIDSPISPEEDEAIEDERAREKNFEVVSRQEGVIDDEQLVDDTGDGICRYDEDVIKWVDIFKRMPQSKQMEALTELVDECSLSHVRHLQSVIEPFFQKDFIRDLPKEIALHVMSFLSAPDIARISLTCRYWRALAEDNRLWKEKCEEINVTEMEKPSERRNGAWAETACTSGIEVVGYRAAHSDRYAFVHECHPHIHRLYTDVDDGPKNVCLARSKWKAMYLRHQRVQANWRSRPLTGSCILKGHEEHVITCLQIHGDLIVTGSDDNTLKVWSASKAICLQTLIGHTGGVWSSQMSECGSIIVSGSTDRTVRV
ncbi:unnamed protein product [Anisakis simplex]|uniref:F-box domain-containing protein n=1 Tax=Anisakis simplex TaxID=6269 RepID=A0A158PPG6_ANISI|nr:unnamed protein product [Anisakis simplex]